MSDKTKATLLVVCMIAVLSLYCLIVPLDKQKEEVKRVPILQNYCGDPVGSIYQTSAMAYDGHTYEDEQGNLWSVNDDVDVNGFYLLWLDDQGTEEVKDDTIVKVWKEEG